MSEPPRIWFHFRKRGLELTGWKAEAAFFFLLVLIAGGVVFWPWQLVEMFS